MDTWFNAVMTFLGERPAWLPAGAFALAFIESIALAGLFIPGATILLGLAVIAGSGGHSFWALVGAACFGAWLADLLSYLLGRYFRLDLQRVWPFSKYPQLWHQGHEFFLRHGGKSVFLGRFLGPMRAIVPAIAGILDMPPGRFQFANLSSAVLWAPLWIAPGYFGGKWLSASDLLQWRLLAFLSGISVLFYAVWYLSRKMARGQPWLEWGQTLLLSGLVAAALVAQWRHWTRPPDQTTPCSGPSSSLWQPLRHDWVSRVLAPMMPPQAGLYPFRSNTDELTFRHGDTVIMHRPGGGWDIARQAIEAPMHGLWFYPAYHRQSCANVQLSPRGATDARQ